MIKIIFIILGIALACIGLYIYKYKKFNLAYISFYGLVESYSSRNHIKNKDQIAMLIGKNYIISGIALSLMSLIILILHISEGYICTVLLVMSIYCIYDYFHIKKVIIR